MSNWSTIVGTLVVCPMGVSEEANDYLLKTTLKHLPRIGIPDCLDHHVSIGVCPARAFAGWSDHDEMGRQSNVGSASRKGFERFGDTNGFMIQSDYMVSVYARLRWQDTDETLRQLMKWLCRLARRIRVAKANLTVCDDWNTGRARIEECGWWGGILSDMYDPLDPFMLEILPRHRAEYFQRVYGED